MENLDKDQAIKNLDAEELKRLRKLIVDLTDLVEAQGEVIDAEIELREKEEEFFRKTIDVTKNLAIAGFLKENGDLCFPEHWKE